MKIEFIFFLEFISFLDQASNFWNKCRKPSSTIDFTTSLNIVKTVLKKAILETQNRYDTHVWHEFNFDTDHVSFFKITFKIIQLQLYIIFREYEHLSMKCSPM